MSDLPNIKTIITALFPWLSIAGRRTYTVARVNADGTLDLDPPKGSTLRRLSGVAQWLIGGAQVTPVVGSEVLVEYRDHDNELRAVTGFAPLSSSRPTTVILDASALIQIGEHATEVRLAAGALTTTYPALRGSADKGGRLYWDSVGSALYYSPSQTAAYALVLSGVGPPTPVTPGTPIELGPGSTIVRLQ